MILVDSQIRSLCIPNGDGQYIADKSRLVYKAPSIQPSQAIDINGEVLAGYAGQPFAASDVYQYETVVDSDKPLVENAILRKEKWLDDKRVPSFGITSAGYDPRLAPEFKIFDKPNDGRIIDILDFNEDKFCTTIESDEIVVPPGGFVLARTIEKFNIPNNVLGTAVGKSTWARTGASILVTPLEPGWSGELVIEITNATNNPAKIYANVGICQILFHVLSQTPEDTYGDGKYQDQRGIVSAKL